MMSEKGKLDRLLDDLFYGFIVIPEFGGLTISETGLKQIKVIIKYTFDEARKSFPKLGDFVSTTYDDYHDSIIEWKKIYLGEE